MAIIDMDAASALANDRSGQGIMTDLRNANRVELLCDGNKVWVNVDGLCLLRVEHVDELYVDTSARPDGVGKVIHT